MRDLVRSIMRVAGKPDSRKMVHRSDVQRTTTTLRGVVDSIDTVLKVAYIDVGGTDLVPADAQAGFLPNVGEEVLVNLNGAEPLVLHPTVMVDGDMQSSNYVFDTSGWRLTYDGDFFANDVSLRGRMQTKEVGTLRTVTLEDGTIALTNGYGDIFMVSFTDLITEGAGTAPAILFFDDENTKFPMAIKAGSSAPSAVEIFEQLRVGPNAGARQHNVLGAWRDVTAGCTFNNINNGTTGTAYIQARRFGRTIQVRGGIHPNGTGIALTASRLNIVLPSADAVIGDFAISSSEKAVGSAHYRNASTWDCSGTCVLNSDGGVRQVDFFHPHFTIAGGSVTSSGPAASWFNAAGDWITFYLEYSAAND